MLFCIYKGERIHISQYIDSMAGDILCPEGHPLIAKRGVLKSHHFAHKGSCDCICSDNKGEWHIWWQNRIQPKYQEIRLHNNDKYHIADICIPGIVIEIQHSNMTEEIMRVREQFYTSLGYQLIWIFDASMMGYKLTTTSSSMIIKWTNGTKFPLYGAYQGKVIKILDFGKKDLFVVTNQSGKSTMIGYKISLEDFDKKFIGDAIIEDVDIRRFHHPLK